MSERIADTKLPQSFDARDWAEGFMEIWANRLTEIDKDLMVTWFANAIMAGHDEAGRRAQAEVNEKLAGMREECAYISDDEAEGLSAGAVRLRSVSKKIRQLPNSAADAGVRAIEERVRKEVQAEQFTKAAFEIRHHCHTTEPNCPMPMAELQRMERECEICQAIKFRKGKLIEDNERLKNSYAELERSFAAILALKETAQ